MTASPHAAESPARFAGLLLGILRHPRATLDRLVALPRRPWRRMALLVIVAVILPAVATYAVAAPATGAGGPAAPSYQESPSMRPVPAPMSSGRGGVVRVGPDGMPAEQPMPAPRSSPITGLALPALGRLGSLAVNWLLWSGVLYVIGTMMGGRNTFGHMLHMVIWTWAPYAVRGVLQAGYILATGQPIAHPGLSGFVAAETTFAGVPAPPNTGALVWRALLGQADVYLFWHLALVAVGLMAVAHLPRRKAVALTLGAWALLTLLSLIPSVVLGSIAGLRMG